MTSIVDHNADIANGTVLIARAGGLAPVDLEATATEEKEDDYHRHNRE